MKSLVARFVCLVALLGTAGAALAADTWQEINRTKTLRVAVALNAPWVVRQPDGTLSGNDITLARLLAEDLGAEPSFVVVPFYNLISTLSSGKADIATAGLAITPERARQVTFSQPTGFQEVSTVAVREAIDPIGSSGALKRGSKIAVLADSTDWDAAQGAWPDTTLIPYPSAQEATFALTRGQVDALVATNPGPRVLASSSDGRLQLVGGALLKTPEAFAIAPDNTRLIAFVNNWIAIQDANGFLRETHAEWFENNQRLKSVAPESGGSK